MATINGTSGNDSLNGTSGNDTLNGLGGNDTLAGSAGTDFYDGGTGSDTLDLRSTAAGITVNFVDRAISGGFTGTFANIERVLGGDGADNLIGAAGNQTLSSRGGNDTLAGAAGNDTLWGGGGADRFVFRETGTANADSLADFASGSDKIVLDTVVMGTLGASGNFAAGDERFVANSSGAAQEADDRVIYETDTRQIWFDPDGTGVAPRELIGTLQSGATLVATDIVVQGQGGGGPAPIVGTEGDDTLIGTSGNDTIDGLGGNDSITGNDGADSLRGGAGNDTLVAGEGHGDSVRDNAADTLDGGLGNDVYYVSAEDVILADPGGIDTVFASGDWTLASGVEDLDLDALHADGTGNELDNRILGAHESTTILGLGGNDTLIVRGAEDGATARGGDGNDTVFGGSGSGFVSLFGDAGNDLLDAGDSAGPETTTMDGGAGNDTLVGGSSEGDTFVFSAAPGGANADIVEGFDTGLDTIVLDGVVHANSGPSGRFAAGDGRFWSSPTGVAQDGDDRVIYNNTSGQLWYDADGNGASTAQLIATLQGAPALDASDIEIVNGTAPTGSVINGTSGNDTLAGTPGDDTIDGLGGNDRVIGNEGADSLRGSSGNDTLVGGEVWFIAGRPDFIGSGRDFAVDTLDGGLGDDVYHVSGTGQDADVIIADAGGIDTVFAWNSDWTLGPGLENLELADDAGVASDGTGNELDNRIASATEGGTLLGLGGNDTLISRIAENSIVMRGGDGNDTLLGNGADGGGDELFGDAGDDLIGTGGGNSIVSGGAGADVFYFDARLDPFENADPPTQRDVVTDFASATDTIRLDGVAMPALGASGRFSAADARYSENSAGTAQDATDRVIYNTSNGDLWYDSDGNGANERLLIGTLQGAPALAATDIEVVNGTTPPPSGNVINGTSGNDTLAGTAGNDTLNGLGGNDTLVGSGGNDFYDGGSGSDTLDLKATSAGVTVSFASGTISGGFSGTFANIERILGSDGADNMSGAAGNQTLSARGGNDTLGGGTGNDTLWGGGGADAFVFGEMGSANADRISDWASGSDKVHLDDAAFTAIGAMGNFAAGDARFKANSSGTATDTNDRVVFNTSTGQLYYDADGSGGGTAQLIATVQSGASVAATDIVVI